MNKIELKEVELIFEPCDSLTDSRGLILDKKGEPRHFHWLAESDIIKKNYKIVKPSLIDVNTKKVVATAWQIPDFHNLSPYDLGVMEQKISIKNIFVELEHTAMVLPERPAEEDWYSIGGEAMCVLYERVKLIDRKVIIYTTRK